MQYILEMSLYYTLPATKRLKLYSYLLEIIYLLEWKVISLILGSVLNEKNYNDIYPNILRFFKYLRIGTPSVRGVLGFT